MTKRLLILATSTTLTLAAASATAATQVGEYLSFSGFGTLGGVATNTNQSEYRRDQQGGGADKKGSLNVDSNLGLQLTATATPWLSATVQMLSVERATKNITTEPEWAFIKLKPVDGLAIRAGRMALPMFAISDSRNVGYVNNWLRTPSEVYGLAGLARLTGGDVTYSAPIGSTTLTGSVLAGKSEVLSANTSSLDATGVSGVNVLWETEWATLRVGQLRAHIHVPTLGLVDNYKFTGAGVLVDRDNIVAQAEYVQRRSEKSASVVDSNGWYAMGGYRFGSVLPYAMFAKTNPVYSVATFHVSGPQKTASLGVRWDVAKSIDVKAQIDRIDTNGTAGVSFIGAVSKPVTAASLAVDFVF
jgi:hypothetical protein